MLDEMELSYLYLPIWGAIVVHIIQAIVMMVTSKANGATDISALLEMIPYDYVPSVLIGASGMAFIAMLKLSFSWYTRLILLIPQQALITIAVFGIIAAVINGSYADGTIKPGVHIFVDQVWLITYAFIHLCLVAKRSSS
jgi:hypothetical protein